MFHLTFKSSKSVLRMLHLNAINYLLEIWFWYKMTSNIIWQWWWCFQEFSGFKMTYFSNWQKMLYRYSLHKFGYFDRLNKRWLQKCQIMISSVENLRKIRRTHPRGTNKIDENSLERLKKAGNSLWNENITGNGLRQLTVRPYFISFGWFVLEFHF